MKTKTKALATVEASITPGWDDLDEQRQADLLEWFNVAAAGVTAEDKERLAALSKTGLFRAWDCPSCSDRVYEGSPESWGGFQGVRQVDYTSYPGDTDKYTPAHLARLCDHCRCHGG